MTEIHLIDASGSMLGCEEEIDEYLQQCDEDDVVITTVYVGGHSWEDCVTIEVLSDEGEQVDSTDIEYNGPTPIAKTTNMVKEIMGPSDSLTVVTDGYPTYVEDFIECVNDDNIHVEFIGDGPWPEVEEGINA